MKKDAEKKDYGKYLSLVSGILTVLVKLIAGAVSASVFVVVSAFYSLSTLVAKTACRIFREKESPAVYLFVAGVTGAAALFYSAGAVKELFEPSGFGYGLIPAIALATVSFADIAAAIAGYVGALKSEIGLDAARRRIDVCKGVAALALTQTALLSVSSEPSGAAFYIPTGIIAAVAMTVSSLLTFYKGAKLFRSRKKADALEIREE